MAALGTTLQSPSAPDSRLPLETPPQIQDATAPQSVPGPLKNTWFFNQEMESGLFLSLSSARTIPAEPPGAKNDPR